MKKFLISLLLLFLMSCGPTARQRLEMEIAEAEAAEAAKIKGQDSTYYAESVFIIDNVRPDQFKEFAQYHAVMSDNTSLGSTEFWFREKARKFKVGDPLTLNFKIIEKPDSTKIEKLNQTQTVNKISK